MSCSLTLSRVLTVIWENCLLQRSSELGGKQQLLPCAAFVLYPAPSAENLVQHHPLVTQRPLLNYLDVGSQPHADFLTSLNVQPRNWPLEYSDCPHRNVGATSDVPSPCCVDQDIPSCSLLLKTSSVLFSFVQACPINDIWNGFGHYNLNMYGF